MRYEFAVLLLLSLGALGYCCYLYNKIQALKNSIIENLTNVGKHIEALYGECEARHEVCLELNKQIAENRVAIEKLTERFETYEACNLEDVSANKAAIEHLAEVVNGRMNEYESEEHKKQINVLDAISNIFNYDIGVAMKGGDGK